MFIETLLDKPLDDMSGKEVQAAEHAADSALKGTGYYRPVHRVESIEVTLPPCLRRLDRAIEAEVVESSESEEADVG